MWHPESSPYGSSAFASPSCKGRAGELYLLRMQSDRISLRLLFFSILAEVIGCREMAIMLPKGSSGEQLLDQLSNQYPVLALHRSTIRLAVNQEYVSASTILLEGDEIAFITPVSGG